ncbi:hypothetical protein [Haloarcula sp. 1CSR25-25]|uniref:hypothetical protein n=1 Tax=Haloarcula sp. 1CSR25-25 TaxID=2862545 RepID=UPI00289FB2A4|nr:hypothetical protein [Haloarcula sp. 1CSR25-25]
MAPQTDEQSLRSLPTVLGLLGIATVVGGLVRGGPRWLGLVGVALVALYLYGPPVFVVALGQVALVAVEAPSLVSLVLVEGGLYITLLSAAVATPHRQTTGGFVALVVPLLGGLAWLSLRRWNLDPLSVGAVSLAGTAIVGYLLHRYLLIELDIVTEAPASDGDPL